MSILGRIKWGNKEYLWQSFQREIESGQILKDSKKFVVGSIMDTQTKKFVSYADKPITSKAMKVIGKGLNLVKTPGFKSFAGAALVGMLLAGVAGYFIGKSGDKENATTDTNNQGGNVHTNDEPVNDNVVKNTLVKELPIAKVVTKEENNYHQINTAKTTWEGIVNAYYPGLIEKCNGKIYGADGAIRKLKIELSKCCEKDLIRESDIPPVLNLPLELDGVKINKTGVPQVAELATGGHTDLMEAGCKTTKKTYLLKDEEKKQEYKSDNINTALDSLKGRTGVPEYKLDYAS